MSQPQPIITEEPQPQIQSPPGFQQPLPGQYPQEYPISVQPMMQPAQPGQPMMQPAQPGQPMVQPAQPGQQMIQPAQPGQQMMQPAQPGQQMMQPAQPVQPMVQPIQMQPIQQTSNTTNVVMINQQPAAPLAPREWSTGLCDCFDDCGSCCLGWNCCLCLLIDVSQRLGEGCCFPCCCPCATTALRGKLRTEQRIQGSLCNDYCITCWCPLLVLCQMSRELQSLGR